MATQNSLNNTTGTLTISTFVAGVVQTNSSGVCSSSNGTNGQVLIGGGSAPTWTTLTQGTGISITNGANSITIASTASAFTWNNVTGTSSAIAVNNGYVANNAGLVTLTLPSTAAFGSVMEVTGGTSGLSSGSWKIAQNSGQTIHYGNQNTTTGTGGSLQATGQYDSIRLVCVTANTDFVVAPGTQGNITVV